MNPYQVVRDFESALCTYTGARYAVSVNSCTMALLLAVRWHILDLGKIAVEIPRRTYLSVPMSIIHAGGWPAFRDEDWRGAYPLYPLTGSARAHTVWDCARRFNAGMYSPGQMQCVSFHAAKILGDTQGGAILHDDPDADVWLRRMRFDGRTEGMAPKDDDIREIGYHAYLSADVAARLLLKLHSLPQHNEDLPNDDYPDLSKMAIFHG